MIQTTHKDFEEFVFSLRPKASEKKEEMREDDDEYDLEDIDSDEEDEQNEMKKKQQKSKEISCWIDWKSKCWKIIIIKLVSWKESNISFITSRKNKISSNIQYE